jgi:hypothetical protein
MARLGRPFGTFKNRQLLDDPNYAPNRLFNRIMQELGLESDRELAEAIRCAPTLISGIRCKRAGLSAAMIIGIMDLTGLQLDEVRQLCGIPKPERKTVNGIK